MTLYEHCDRQNNVHQRRLCSNSWNLWICHHMWQRDFANAIKSMDLEVQILFWTSSVGPTNESFKKGNLSCMSQRDGRKRRRKDSKDERDLIHLCRLWRWRAKKKSQGIWTALRIWKQSSAHSQQRKGAFRLTTLSNWILPITQMSKEAVPAPEPAHRDTNWWHVWL